MIMDIKMGIKQVKKELGLKDKDIAEMFGMSRMSYANSSAKKRYETALCRFYSRVTEAQAKEKKSVTVNDGSQP